MVDSFEQARIPIGQGCEGSEASAVAVNWKAEVAQELLERRLLLDGGESFEDDRMVVGEADPNRHCLPLRAGR